MLWVQQVIEDMIEHADDLAGFIIDDFAGFFVVERRNCETAVVVGV